MAIKARGRSQARAIFRLDPWEGAACSTGQSGARQASYRRWIDNFAAGISRERYYLRTSTGRIRLRLGGASLRDLAGRRVQVRGTRHGAVLSATLAPAGLGSVADPGYSTRCQAHQ